MSSAATIDNKKTPSTKQELIAAIELLIEHLEAGHSEALTNYLTAMSRFHNYSFGNSSGDCAADATAARVAGFRTWKNLGRSVNAGAKGIRIPAPIVGVRRKKDEEAEKDITKHNSRTLLGFRNAYVFDISQTNGVDLPEMREISGDPGENIDRLAAFLKAQGIQLVYNPKIVPALGISYGGRIAILPGQTKAEEFSTRVHETAHEMLHKAERRTATTKAVSETEAEAVAISGLSVDGRIVPQTVLIHAAVGTRTFRVRVGALDRIEIVGTARRKNFGSPKKYDPTPMKYGECLLECVRDVASQGIDATLHFVGTDEAVDVSLQLVHEPLTHRDNRRIRSDEARLLSGDRGFRRSRYTNMLEPGMTAHLSS